MNLLYLSIIIPLFSFLILVCFRRHIRIDSLLIIGVSTIILLMLLVGFVYIDYQTNTLPDTSLIYARHLWDWLVIGNFNVSITLYLDSISLIFLSLMVITSLIIYFFAASYLSTAESIYSFFAYGNLLIASLILLILADNLFILFIGWEGVSFATYLMIGIYYQNIKVGFAAVRAFIVIHITDLFLLMGIFLIYNELNTLNIRDILALANHNLAIDSDIVFSITTLLFIGVMGKMGVFPFHSSFSATSVATMPGIALLQSCILVLAGSYLIIRLGPLFVMSTDIFKVIEIVAAITIIFSGCISLVQQDIKRLITYVNLGQMSYILLALSTQNWNIAFGFLTNYIITSSLLLLSSALLIKTCNGERDIYKIGGLYRHNQLLYCCFWLCALSISAMPWITTGFYIKADIISELINANQLGVAIVGLTGILLFTLSILRLLFAVFHHSSKQSGYGMVTKLDCIPLVILIVGSIITLFYLPAPRIGPLSVFDLNIGNQLALQLLLTALTVLGILIAYILFIHSKSEINELLETPIGKLLMHLWTTEWRFDKFVKVLLIIPYLFLTKLVINDPLSMWVLAVNSGIKKINFQIVSLENGKLRWYIMSIVGGSIIILLLLILV